MWGMYEWSLYDRHGNLMAGGEEFELDKAYNQAALSVLAVQAWCMVGRGSLHTTRTLGFVFKPRYVKEE